MDTLDKKMQTILEREDLSEDERLKLYDQSFTQVSSFMEIMQRATVLLQMQSVLVGIPKIHLSVRSLSSFFQCSQSGLISLEFFLLQFN
jgi:hypothetical protein